MTNSSHNSVVKVHAVYMLFRGMHWVSRLGVLFQGQHVWPVKTIILSKLFHTLKWKWTWTLYKMIQLKYLHLFILFPQDPKKNHAFGFFVWRIKTCHSRDVRVFFFEPIAAHEVGPCQQNNPKCCRVFLRNAYMLSIAIPRFCTKKCRCMRVCNTFSMLLPICFHPFPFVLVGGTIMFDKGHGQQFPLAVTRSQV